MTQLCLIKFGSHLYGTSTPESDLDLKGVYLPDIEDCILGKVKDSINTNSNQKCKNSPNDEDFENYSLQFFLKLACQGQIAAIDMLHAPNDCILQTSGAWGDLRKRRGQFYSRNMNAFLGYCKNQAAKYSIKADKILALEDLGGFFIRHKALGYSRLKDVYGVVPVSQYVEKVIEETNRTDDPRALKVCGRIIQLNVSLSYALQIVDGMINGYGERAQKAKEMGRADWKAISHAFRACYELKEIYETGDLKFPLKDAGYLLKIKNGELEYQSLSAQLDDLIVECEELSAKSAYPEKINLDHWNNFVVNLY